MPITGHAGVLHLGDPADRLQPGRQRGDRADVGVRQRSAGPGRYQRDRDESGGAEWRSKLCRVRARRAGGKELLVVVLGHAVQRGKQ